MTPASDPDLKAALLADARAHLQVYGPKQWKLVRDKYPTVNERTFYRWINELRDAATRDLQQPVTKAESAVAISEAGQRARLHAIKNVPAPPPPEYLARAGARGDRHIDFLTGVEEIWADALLLRRHALAKVKDPDTGELSVKIDPATGDPVIGNTSTFDSSIKRRLEVMTTALKVMQEIWDVGYMQKFFDAIVDIIVTEVAEHPEIQERIMRRLQTLNERRGMTLYAGMD